MKMVNYYHTLMLILNNIDAGYIIAPEFTKENNKFLGVQKIKTRFDRRNNRESPYSNINSKKVITTKKEIKKYNITDINNRNDMVHDGRVADGPRGLIGRDRGAKDDAGIGGGS